MRDIGNRFGWTPRFQRMFVLWTMIGVSPFVTLLGRISDVSPNAKAAAIAVAFGIELVAGCWFFFNIVPSPNEEPMRERESFVLGLLVAFVLTLVTYEGWFQFFR